MDGSRLLGEAFELAVGSDVESCSLQDAFKSFMKRRKVGSKVAQVYWCVSYY